MILGKTGLKISRVGFGAIPIQRLTDDDAVAVVKRCLELGITYLDTANAYSTSERRMGIAMQGWKGDVIVSRRTQSRTPEGVAAHLAQSLQMLKMDSIHLYQFHNVSSFPELEKIMDPKGTHSCGAGGHARGQGQAHGHHVPPDRRRQRGREAGRFETIMYPFNFIAHEPGEELAALAAQTTWALSP